MPHLASVCDCGRAIHLPRSARPGYVWKCKNCGRSYVLGNGGSGRQSVVIPSKAPRISEVSLICRVCHKRFVFTTGEQKFYVERGLSAPKRCPACRAQKKGKGPEPSFWQKLFG